MFRHNDFRDFIKEGYYENYLDGRHKYVPPRFESNDMHDTVQDFYRAHIYFLYDMEGLKFACNLSCEIEVIDYTVGYGGHRYFYIHSVITNKLSGREEFVGIGRRKHYSEVWFYEAVEEAKILCSILQAHGINYVSCIIPPYNSCCGTDKRMEHEIHPGDEIVHVYVGCTQVTYCKSCYNVVFNFDAVEKLKKLQDNIDKTVQDRTQEYVNRMHMSNSAHTKIQDWVYLARMTGTGSYKIGKAADPYKRIRAIQTPSPLEQVIVKQVVNASEVEKTLHKKYKDYRTHGEWFELEDIDEVVETFKNLQ